MPTAKAAAEQRKAQAEYLKVRGQLNATSSQDEFAKWAKLRRQHDKLLDQLEKTSTYSSESKNELNITNTDVLLLQRKAWKPHDRASTSTLRASD